MAPPMEEFEVEEAGLSSTTDRLLSPTNRHTQDEDESDNSLKTLHLQSRPRNRLILLWNRYPSAALALSFGVAALLMVGVAITILLPRNPKVPAEFVGSDAFPFIDPLIGTAHGGHVFPGATIPYGMAKAVADCANENAGGYSTDERCYVVGFSHTHDSGTGGATSFGNFGILPQPGCPEDELEGCFYNRKIPELLNSTVASPGYFGIKLENGVAAEMTVTSHAALYSFDIGKNDSVTYSPIIHVNMRDLYGSLKNGSVTVSKEGRMQGFGKFQPSFGPAVWKFGTSESYRLYFCADFLGDVRRTGTWIDSDVFPGVNTRTTSAKDWGAYIQFNANDAVNIKTRVGISFVSESQACQNAEREIPDFNFTKTKDAAVQAWKPKFDNIAIDATGVSNDTQTIFWSGIYRTLLSPQDYTGENPLWDSSEPYFDSFYCIWDSFRSTDPFLNIIDPEAHTLMMRTLLDIYKHEGKLPDCRMSLCKGDTQGGSNADVVIADNWLKGLKEGVNWTLAYEAVVSDAEDEPLDWSVEGRGNLESWKTIGYIPVDAGKSRRGTGLDSRSVSRSLEYAYEDYCIATLAKSQGRVDDYEKYIKRSQNWRKLFNPDVRSTINGKDSGFSGFVQPRLQNGSFQYEDPSLCNPVTGMSRQCYLFQGGYSTYEGGSWLYSFFVPHDMAALIDVMGGKETFVRRLQYFHDTGIADISDEQGFLTVFQYHYANRPGLSSKQVDYYFGRNFSTTAGGIPGNDDSGSMGSFVVFCMMGIFPNPGQDVYLLIAPYFPEIRLNHPQTKKVATIKVTNPDAISTKRYIQAVKLNGSPYTKSWITHDFFTEGGTLEYTLGEEEGTWGTHDQDIPPSWSSLQSS